MQETINLLHTTIDKERQELLQSAALKETLLNQVVELHNQQSLRKEKVERLERELKSLYANQTENNCKTTSSLSPNPANIDCHTSVERNADKVLGSR